MDGGTLVGVQVALESPFMATTGVRSPVYDARGAEQQHHEALAYISRRARCGLIVMASPRGNGVAARLGSETQLVLTHCDLPVLVVH
jgi:hypothetical protein